MNAPEQLAVIYSLLQQRRLAEAESACTSVLSRSPSSSDARHLLGLIRKQAGDFAAAEQLLRQSIELSPQRGDFHANLGNLLRSMGRLEEARQAYASALRVDSRHVQARLGLARTLNELQQPEAAEGESRTLIGSHPDNAEAWGTLGIALRAQQRFAEAESAYREALRLKPSYAVARHNLGALMSQLDRVEEALDEFNRAAALGVSSAELALNRGHALLKLYRLDDAERAYVAAVSHKPIHIDAHVSLASLRFMRGDSHFARDFIAVAAANPTDVRMQLALAQLLQRAGDAPAAQSTVRRAMEANGATPELQTVLAGLLQDEGRLEEALVEAERAAVARPGVAGIIERLVMIQLALGRLETASTHIAEQRSRDPLEQRWIAYESIAARLANTSRYRELCDYDRFVRVYDLPSPSREWSTVEEFNAALHTVLSGMHRFENHPLEQSLRQGTQTARSLLAESDPLIRQALKAFAEPLHDFLAHLDRSSVHPFLSRNTMRARIDKCWSVRLRRHGFHLNHVHPQGWISSAYYVSVPREVEDEAAMSGWLKFGEPMFAVSGCGPERLVQPRSGRLVLFPSYLWHGTTQILGSQPRVTIAFDALPV